MNYYSYQPEEPRNLGNLYPGWPSNMQYPPVQSEPMERNWSNSTGTSNQATWSESGERNHALSSPVTPTSAHNSPGGYYAGDTTQATPKTSGIADWALYYKFIIPEDKRKESYWELQDCYEPSDTMPKRRPVEKRKKTGKELYPCLEPGCTTPKPFKRMADLQRHYAQLHAPPDPSSKYHCDYPKCSRATDPLGRKDHYRDHLRDFHGEDLIKRSKDKKKSSSKKSKSSSSKEGKSSENNENSSSTAQRVNVSLKWWRCTKCLERKCVVDGWFCNVCKKECEQERVANRMRKSRRSNRYRDENLEDYVEEEEYIKSESSLSPTFSTTSTVYQPPGYVSEQAGNASIYQEYSETARDRGCVHGCDNTWVYNQFTASYDPCPSCQALGTKPSIPETSDITTPYQPGYSGYCHPNLNPNTNAAYLALSTSIWQQQQQEQQHQQQQHTMAAISDYENNISFENRMSPTATETGAPLHQYKTNCGNCSNYAVWDGANWIPCLVCQAPVEVLSQSRSHHKSRHGHGHEKQEKEKKRVKRSSGWFR